MADDLLAPPKWPVPRRGGARWLRLVLKGSLAAAVVLFWALFIRRNWDALTTIDWSLEPLWAVAALVTFGLYYLAQGAGWSMIARATGHQLRMSPGIGIWLLSMPARYVPGNLWHIAARISLASGQGMPPGGVVLSSTVEQMLMVLSAACLGLAWIPSWMGASVLPWSAVLFLGCLIGLQPPALRRALAMASRVSGRRVGGVNLRYRHMALLMAWYMLVNSMNGLGFALLSTAAGRAGPDLWPSLASAYCLAYVVGYVSFLTPSGIGVREAALASMLGIYMSTPAALALTLLARLLSTGAEALAVSAFGLPSWLRGRAA